MRSCSSAESAPPLPGLVSVADAEDDEEEDVVMMRGEAIPHRSSSAGAEEAGSLRALSLTPGTRFERYDIEALVGRGGMGEVYRATDSRLHRPVALKIMRTDNEAAFAVSEAGGTARLSVRRALRQP